MRSCLCYHSEKWSYVVSTTIVADVSCTKEKKNFLDCKDIVAFRLMK